MPRLMVKRPLTYAGRKLTPGDQFVCASQVLSKAYCASGVTELIEVRPTELKDAMANFKPRHRVLRAAREMNKRFAAEADSPPSPVPPTPPVQPPASEPTSGEIERRDVTPPSEEPPEDYLRRDLRAKDD